MSSPSRAPLVRRPSELLSQSAVAMVLPLLQLQRSVHGYARGLKMPALLRILLLEKFQSCALQYACTWRASLEHKQRRLTHVAVLKLHEQRLQRALRRRLRSWQTCVAVRPAL